MEAPLPERVTIARDAGILTITYRWLSWKYVFFAFFCIFWDGFLLSWYGTALKKGWDPANPAVWFPLLHVAIGIGLTYSTIAGFLNTTRVVVQSGEIAIRHGPLPWLGNRRLGAQGIRQLYREERLPQSNKSSASYHLNAITGDNRKITLIRSVPSADVALYLEQEIEKALGIDDRRVAGEMQK
jgi:hypothetical protein